MRHTTALTSLLLSTLAATATGTALTAQDAIQRLTARGTRFELGQRLRVMERALQADTSQAQIDKVLSPLSDAVQSFFRGDVAAVGQTLVQCASRLSADRDPTLTEYALGSLCVVPATHLLSGGSTELSVALVSLFETDWGETAPPNCTVQFVLTAPNRPPIPLNAGSLDAGSLKVSLGSLPTSFTLALKNVGVLAGSPLPEGDYQLTAMVRPEGAPEPFKTEPLTLSIVDTLEERVTRIDQASDAIPRGSRSSTTETLRHTVRILTRLGEPGGDETNHPGLELIQNAEAMLEALAQDQPWFGPKTTGDLRVRLDTDGGLVIARLMVPEGLEPGQTVPLVIALHGAGGSENMFFDGYGDGLGTKLARDRGWIFLSPRTSTRPDALAAVVAELGRYYPIDTQRVYLLGHSMGAGATAANFQASPETYRAIALIGGGGSVRDRSALAQIPILVAIGDKDFLRQGALAFSRSVKRANDHQLTLLEYKNVEHMAVVQLALPDVFEFFETHK